FAEAGRYRIEAFTPAPHNQSRRAVYRVTHGSMTTEVPVDQQAVDGWNLIGELEFAAGGAGQSVRLDDNTGEPVDTQTKLVFDALRVTRLDGPTGEDGGDDSGCAAAGAGAGAAWLAIALGVVTRRRRTRRGGADRRGGAPCARPRGRGCT
ncbi:MAG: golvesin C-terminal-like domain-containing protein, partial [Kofleriaceae bacterium]